MPRRLPRLVAILFLLGPGAGAQEDPAIERWVAELGAREYETRVAAEASLVSAGRKAYRAILAATRSEDPEVASRALHILPRVRWGITPELVAQAGEEIARYDELSPPARAAALEKVRAARTSVAAPFLVAAIEEETDERTWTAAWNVLCEVAPHLAAGALERSAARPDAPEFVVSVQVREWSPGGARSGETVERERILAVVEAFLARSPLAKTAWTWTPLAELLLDIGEEDVLRRLASRLREAPGEGWSRARLAVATVLDERGRTEEAGALLRAVLADSEARTPPDAWTPPPAATAIHLLLCSGRPEEAWRAAAEILSDEGTPGELATRIAGTFLDHLEVDRIGELAGRLPREIATRRARWLLDAEAGLAARRALLEEAGEDRSARLVALRDLAEEFLWHGLGDEALDLVQSNREALEAGGSFAGLAVRAALAAGDPEMARSHLGKLEGQDSQDPERVRAGCLAELIAGAPEEARQAARSLGYSFPEYRLVDREAQGEPLTDHAKRLARVAFGLASGRKSIREQQDELRRARWLARDPGTKDRALVERIVGMHPFAGFEVLAAAGDLQELAAAPECQRVHPLLAAWAAIRTGSPERAEAILESAPAGRPAERLRALAARARGDEEMAREIGGRLDAGELALEPALDASASFFAARGELAEAARDWELLAAGTAGMFARHADGKPTLSPHGESVVKAWAGLAVHHEARGEPGRSADWLARVLAAHLATGARTEESYHRTRSRILHLRGLDAASRGEDDRALELLRRAWGIDPLHAEAALAYAVRAAPRDEVRAARALRLAIYEFRRRTDLDPFDPEPHADLATALSLSSREEDRLASVESARRAVDLSGGEARFRDLLDRLCGR